MMSGSACHICVRIHRIAFFLSEKSHLFNVYCVTSYSYRLYESSKILYLVFLRDSKLYFQHNGNVLLSISLFGYSGIDTFYTSFNYTTFSCFCS